jgi:hypothetical protein
VPYQSSLFSEELYRELTKKLSDKEEEKLRREIHRLELRQKDVNSRLWDDIVSEKCRFTLVTASGKKFSISGRNWPAGYQSCFAEPAELNDDNEDDSE